MHLKLGEFGVGRKILVGVGFGLVLIVMYRISVGRLVTLDGSRRDFDK